MHLRNRTAAAARVLPARTRSSTMVSVTSSVVAVIALQASALMPELPAAETSSCTQTLAFGTTRTP